VNRIELQNPVRINQQQSIVNVPRLRNIAAAAQTSGVACGALCGIVLGDEDNRVMKIGVNIRNVSRS
jgi:hypothetical protein